MGGDKGTIKATATIMTKDGCGDSYEYSENPKNCGSIKYCLEIVNGLNKPQKEWKYNNPGGGCNVKERVEVAPAPRPWYVDDDRFGHVVVDRLIDEIIYEDLYIVSHHETEKSYPTIDLPHGWTSEWAEDFLKILFDKKIEKCISGGTDIELVFKRKQFIATLNVIDQNGNDIPLQIGSQINYSDGTVDAIPAGTLEFEPQQKGIKSIHIKVLATACVAEVIARKYTASVVQLDATVEAIVDAPEDDPLAVEDVDTITEDMVVEAKLSGVDLTVAQKHYLFDKHYNMGYLEMNPSDMLFLKLKMPFRVGTLKFLDTGGYAQIGYFQVSWTDIYGVPHTIEIGSETSPGYAIVQINDEVTEIAFTNYGTNPLIQMTEIVAERFSDTRTFAPEERPVNVSDMDDLTAEDIFWTEFATVDPPASRQLRDAEIKALFNQKSLDVFSPGVLVFNPGDRLTLFLKKPFDLEMVKAIGQGWQAAALTVEASEWGGWWNVHSGKESVDAASECYQLNFTNNTTGAIALVGIVGERYKRVGAPHSHPVNINNVDEVTSQDLSAASSIDFDGVQDRIDYLFDGKWTTERGYIGKAGGSLLNIYLYLNKPLHLAEIKFLTELGVALQSPTNDNTYLNITYADSSSENILFRIGEPMIYVPKPKEIALINLSMSIPEAVTILLSDIVLLRKTFSQVSAPEDKPVNVSDMDELVAEDIPSIIYTEIVIAPNAPRQMTQAEINLLFNKQSTSNAGIMMNTGDYISITLKKPFKVQRIKTLAGAGRSLFDWEVTDVDGNIHTATNTMLMECGYEVSIIKITKNGLDAITQLLIERYSDIHAPHQHPVNIEEVDELTLQDINPDVVKSFISNGTVSQSVDVLFDGKVSTAYTFINTSGGPVMVDVAVVLNKPLHLSEIKFISSEGYLLLGLSTSNTLIVTYADPTMPPDNITFNSGEPIQYIPKPLEISAINLSMLLQDQDGVVISELVLLRKKFMEVSAPEKRPLNVQPLEELTREDIVSAVLTPEGGSSVPLTDAQIWAMFDKDPATSYAIRAPTGDEDNVALSLFLKKTFRTKRIKILSKDVGGNLYYPVPDVGTSDFQIGIYNGTIDPDTELPIVTYFDTNPAAIDDEVVRIDIVNSAVVPLTIVELIGELFMSRETFGQAYQIGINGAVSVDDSTTAVLAANPKRKYAAFVNDSDTVIYLALGEDAVLNAGIRLNSNGGSYEIDNTNLFKEAVNAICSVAGKNLTVVEGT